MRCKNVRQHHHKRLDVDAIMQDIYDGHEYSAIIKIKRAIRRGYDVPLAYRRLVTNA